MYDADVDISALTRALLGWERTHNTVRPHQALDGRTQAQYLEGCRPESYRVWALFGVDTNGRTDYTCRCLVALSGIVEGQIFVSYEIYTTLPMTEEEKMRNPRAGEPSENSAPQLVGSTQVLPDRELPVESVQSNEYAELIELIRQGGLMGKQPAYYTYKILLTLGLLAMSLTFLAILDNLWLQILNGVFMAFVFVQIGLVGHDAGHRQIFRSARRNDVILLVVGFLIGLGPSWWDDKHNRRHHDNPNNLDLDFDVNLPLIAFNEEQALSKRGPSRLVVKYQAYLFFPMLFIEALSIRMDSLQYLLRGKNVKYPLAESVALVAHFVVYLVLVFYFLSVWHAAVFIMVHQSLIGVYMGSVFATNHKGMLLLGQGRSMDFLHRQVLTSRNLNANPITDFCYGGLNYQIEHHLFPNMPRNKLKEAQKIVRPFCEQHGISYCETGAFRSYKEILQYLHRVSGVLRRQRA